MVKLKTKNIKSKKGAFTTWNSIKSTQNHDCVRKAQEIIIWENVFLCNSSVVLVRLHYLWEFERTFLATSQKAMLTGTSASRISLALVLYVTENVKWTCWLLRSSKSPKHGYFRPYESKIYVKYLNIVYKLKTLHTNWVFSVLELNYFKQSNEKSLK